MQDLEGRVAVITGGGSGIGRGMALAFGEAGMKVVVAEIDAKAAEGVVAELAERGVEAVAERVDVVDRESVRALADRVYARFGAVHVLCNNAGVSAWSTIQAGLEQEWDWVMGVNLDGVLNGLLVFVPRMAAQEGESHVVNTGSTASLGGIPSLGHYVASKHGVLGVSEVLRIEGAASGMSCSVLCPGAVSTGIVKAARNRQSDFGGPTDEFNPHIQAAIDEGIDPEEVGRIVRQAVIDDDLYIFTHPDSRQAIENRYHAMMAAQEKAEKRMAGQG
jgi:NAD(P)-dependent dehydrogenase (short-subunit alcohol dehydrogenase family)